MFIHLNGTLADSNQGKLNSCHLKEKKKTGLTDLQTKGEISLTETQTHSQKCQGKHLERRNLGGDRERGCRPRLKEGKRDDLHAPKNPHGL